MNCEAALELIGADPEGIPPELRAHLDGCPACQAKLADMRAFDAKLRRALQFNPAPLMSGSASPASAQVTPGSPRAAGSRRASSRRGRRARRTVLRRPRHPALAIAASLAGAFLVALTLWLSRPTPTLASEIVAHVEGEPDSWARTAPISPAQLGAVLRKSGVTLGAAIGPVVYANSCWFRGHFVPHLVVSTPSGPVTVMILKHEHVTRDEHFDEDGYAGMLVPAPQGSVAILSRAQMPLEQPAMSVVHALRVTAESAPR